MSTAEKSSKLRPYFYSGNFYNSLSGNFGRINFFLPIIRAITIQIFAYSEMLDLN